MKKYIIIANDRTLEGNPRRMWVHTSKDECLKNMDFISQNNGWTIPIYYEIENIIIDGKFLQ